MIDLRAVQKKVYNNKVKKGFNTTDVYKEFCLIHEEVAEACRAHYKNLPDLGEELADVTIYLLGLSEMLGIDLEREITKKIEKNETREYRKINGRLVRTKDS